MSESDFRTLGRPVEIAGIGLHSGQTVRARLLPHPQRGIFFRRDDLPGAPLVPADTTSIVGTTHATTLQCGAGTVSTTEHLLAALWMHGVTHCIVALDGPEVPILDGSAADWCRLLHEAGTVTVSASSPRPVYTLREPVWFSEGEVSVLGLPHSTLRLSVSVEFAREYVGQQSLDLNVTTQVFDDAIAPARTFALEEWLEPLRGAGLIRGGSIDNAIVLGPQAPSSSWRFPDEVVRHKALDVLGDIALLFGSNGGRLQAHLIAIRAGHGAHRQWMNECSRRSALLLCP
jgi:UDP-3-O-[3-hydroxymyristoyl] N-acetylglucosamine deacetylase